MTSADADHNLLYGIFALQNDLISREDLIAAFSTWVQDKSKRLDQVLLDQKRLTPDEHAMLEPLVRRHLKRHGDDPERSLAALGAVGSAREVLAAISNPDTEATLEHPVTAPEPGAESTTDYVRQFGGTDDAPQPDGARYRILRPHARGNLGLVSVALDAELHREVALKEIQRRHADEPASRARFLLEGEITGRLEHPGVVPVYGLGTNRDGRPYYAMRFVKGDTLKEALEAFHATDENPKRDPTERSLSLRKLLTRFVAVCEAMHYAHSRGVIHRDIKPANILLGSYGETLVVDWGLAKVVGRDDPSASTEATIQSSSGSGSTETQTGAAIGTPAYMSPEQAEGRLDAVGIPSDIYGLGATLYAVVAGKAPLQGGNALEVLRQVQRGAFPPPRQVNPRVPKGLEAIVLKAMSFKPEDRYPTARALADDLEHWLNDAPISALPESWSQRLARWMRRHRAATQAAAVALLVITAVAIASALLIDQALGRERTALAAETRAKKEADTERDLAINAVKKFRDAVANNPDLKDREDLKSLRETLLKEPQAFFKTLRDQLQSSRDTRPESLARLSSALIELAGTTDELSDQEVALRARRESLAIFERLAREHPTVTEYQRDLAASHNNLGVQRSATGQSAAALESYQQALAIRERLAREHPTVTEYQRDLARSHNALGALQGETGQLAAALESFQQALAIFERLAREHPTVTEYQSEVGMTLNNLALIEMDRKSWESARVRLLQAVEYQRNALRVEPQNPNYRQFLGDDLGNLAETCLALRRPEEAAQAARELVKLTAGNPVDLYAAACFLSLCTGMTTEMMTDGKKTDDRKHAAAYADEAMTVLRAAVTAGWSRADHTAHDPDLVPLHNRPDFRRLLAELFDRGFPREPFAR